MPPTKRARCTASAQPRPFEATPRAEPSAFQRLPDDTRAKLKALLQRRKFGEDEAWSGAADDPVAALLAKHLPNSSPFAWLDPENLMLPVCWQDPLAGPVEACCLLEQLAEAMPSLGRTSVVATKENLLTALEAVIVKRTQHSSKGDTALLAPDAGLVGEAQEDIMLAAKRHLGAAALKVLCADLDAMWPQVVPLLKTVRHEGQRRVTTRYRLQQDQRLVQYLMRREGHFVLPAFEVRGTEQQRAVASEVFTHLGRHGWSVLSGPGGAGKTFLLGQLAAALRGHAVPNEHASAVHCPICGACFPERCFECGFVRPTQRERPVSIALTAPTNRAVAVLRKVVDGFVGSIVCYTLHALAKSALAMPVDVLVVDEASMLAAEHGDLILQTPALRLACVLLVGDAAQLPPVGSGELLRPLLTAARLPSLTVNMRAEAELAEPLQRVRSGDVTCMGAHTTVCADVAARHRAVFEAATSAGGGNIVLATLNDDRIAYCRYAMQRLAPHKDPRDDYLAEKSVPRLFVPFASLPVRFQTNFFKPTACSGMLGEVVDVAEEAGSFEVDVRVATPAGVQVVQVNGNLAQVAVHLRPAYAVTTHDSQGGEFDRVDILLPASVDCPLNTRELLYTAVSRARRCVALWSLRHDYAAYVPRLSQVSAERVTPLVGLLRAELQRQKRAASEEATAAAR